MSQNEPLSPEKRKRVMIWLVGSLLYIGLIGLVLFLSAGTLDWMGGWRLVLLMLVCFTFMAGILLPLDPDLLIERSQVKENTKAWDQVVMRVMNGSANFLTPLIAGLDVRFGWTEQMPLWLVCLAALVMTVSLGFQVWAMATNTFFSGVVRIQSERGHHVINQGPYHWVRHPGYLGMFFYFLSVAFVLGSWWSLLPAVVAVSALVLRTSWEDKTLQNELPGYLEYTHEVPYRLLPGIW
ncbi:MAG: isoprenylcysteine carboxylmethyltransferase family protein [Anaerolineae bacterium]|nr:isoprenylcysteine carboxylmethyltransferase family protein [Anaerolineae bacterium]